MEQVYITRFGIEFDVRFTYSPFVPATWDDPGEPEWFETAQVYVGGVDVSAVLDAAVADQVSDAAYEAFKRQEFEVAA